MKNIQIKLAEWFLRLALSIGMLSAVADRFGLWPITISVGKLGKFSGLHQNALP